MNFIEKMFAKEFDMFRKLDSLKKCKPLIINPSKGPQMSPEQLSAFQALADQFGLTFKVILPPPVAQPLEVDFTPAPVATV